MKLTHEILLEIGFLFVQFPNNDSNIKYYELNINKNFIVSIMDDAGSYQTALEDVNSVYDDNNYDSDPLDYEIYNVDSVKNLLEIIGIAKYQQGREQKAQEIRNALQIN